MGLAKVFVDVVELPLEVVRVWLCHSCCRDPRQTQRRRACDPAVLEHRSIANKLEILRRMVCGSLCVIECVNKTDAFDWLLLDSVQDVRRCDPSSFINCRHNVNDMAELRAQSALVLDLRWPRNDHPVARPAEMRCDLLGPLHWRVHRVSPSDRIMVVGQWPAKIVDLRKQKRQVFLDAITCRRDFVSRSL